MEIPNLVRERLGGESIEATVNLGDEDMIAVTPTRTILYRGEGLLSDESVSVYSHDVERLNLSEGRRNTKFSLTYVDGTQEFKVPGGRAETLLQILMQGILRSAGVADDDESVAGVFQFSELTLVVTENRLVKHVGAPVWDDDFEVFDYADVTALDFEEGSVATQIILTVGGRPQRIKAPSEDAPQVEQTLTQTLCSYYDVNSLEELAARLAADEEEADPAETATEPPSTELELDDGISPLVGGDSDEAEDPADSATDPEESAATAGPDSPTLDQSTTATDSTAEAEQSATGSSPTESRQQSEASTGQSPDQTAQSTAETRQSATQSAAVPDVDGERVDPEDIDAIKEQLSTLTEAVKRQNELLRQHNERLEENDEKVDQLIEELRRGR
jgi:hypothetical protein